MIDNKEINDILDTIARDAATTWCRCWKCDGEVRNFPDVEPWKCDKDSCSTCFKWRDGYRTAMIAFEDLLNPQSTPSVKLTDKLKELLKPAIVEEAWKQYPNSHTETDYGECDYNEGERESFIEGVEFVLNNKLFK